MLKSHVSSITLAVAMLLASPIVFAQSARVDQRPTPAERAQLRSAHQAVKSAHEQLNADRMVLKNDKLTHASPAKIAMDRQTAQQQKQVFLSVKAQSEQVRNAFFAAHPDAKARWELRQAQGHRSFD